MPTHNVQLTEHFDKFIETVVESGRFHDVSEAVGEGLLLLEEREAEDRAKLERLRAAAKEGFDAIDRGAYTQLHSPDEVSAFVRQLGSKSARRNVESTL